MFTHAQIWRGIDRLAAHAQTSPSGLARRAGLDSTTFNPSKRFSSDGKKSRWPSTESVAKALSAANVNLADFAVFVRGEKVSSGLPSLNLADTERATAFSPSGTPEGDRWDQVDFPGVAADQAYVLGVVGDAMAPIYRDGTQLIIAREEKPRPGDRIIVKTRDGEILAWELVTSSVHSITLNALNPDQPNRVIKLTDVEWLARIIWASQ
jgi:phage repressor protein C with HTH and peptisase S24 domain